MQRYIDINRILRGLAVKAWDGIDAGQYSDEYTTGTIRDYIHRDIRDLKRVWPAELLQEGFDEIVELANKGDVHSFREIASTHLPKIEDALDEHYSSIPNNDMKSAIADFLHPSITASSYTHFVNGHYREAVFNAIVAVFDMLRWRTHLDLDGAALVTQALSLDKPIITMASLSTESGKNIQKGFIEMLKGAYLGVRNPKAHSLATDLNEVSAAQYLVFASLLARKVESANKVESQE